MKQIIAKMNIKRSIIVKKLAIMMIVLISCFSIIANAEIIATSEVEEEKTMVKVAAIIVRSKDTDNKVKKDALETELAKYIGAGKTTVAEKAGDSETLVVTFNKTGNSYEVNINSGPLLADIGASEVVHPANPDGTLASAGGGGAGVGPSMTLAAVTNDNIGDYIDLGNNIVGTESTADDWRVFYVEGSTVYAILADYLPNSTNYAANAGLDTSGTYSVYSNTSRDTFLTGLTTSSNWNGLANGINGATATGSPTGELLTMSYKVKSGTDFDYTTDNLNSAITDYDLYVPHTSALGSCYGYWLASPDEKIAIRVWDVYYNGSVAEYFYNSQGYALRPVVELPSSTACSYSDGVWTIGGDGGSEPSEPSMTLASVTNANIGDYIDLGNNIVGTTSTADDWRVLYVEGSTVYAILADYLPNSTNYAANAGLDINGTYGVYSDIRGALLTGLTTEANWNELANGISGATVTGTPTGELLMNSYNTKNGTSLEYTDYPNIIDEATTDYDLYVPRIEAVDLCGGYWLASSSTNKPYYMWYVSLRKSWRRA